MHLLIGSLTLLSLAIALMVSRYRESLPSPSSLFSRKKKFFIKEKRIFPRYQALLRTKYKTPAEEGISWIKDISRGGVRLFLNSIDINTIVSLEVELPFNRQSVFMQGNIVWKRGTDSGLRFGAAEQEDLSRVLEFVGNREQMKMAQV